MCRSIKQVTHSVVSLCRNAANRNIDSDHFRIKISNPGKFNLIVFKGEDGQMKVRHEPLREIRTDLKQIIEEMK